MLVGKTLRLVAAVFAVACCLAAPAGATELPVTPGTSAVTDGLTETSGEAADTVAAVRPVHTAVEAAARPVDSAVKTVAATRTISTPVGTAAAVTPGRAAADTAAAAGPRVRPVVDEAARRLSETAAGAGKRAGEPGAAGERGSEPRPALRDRHGEAGAVTARAARLQVPGAGLDTGSALTLLGASPMTLQAAPATHFPGASQGATPASGADVGAALQHRSSTAPAPAEGGGSPSASAGGASFPMGGLAVLLVTLSLAGPALRRRLPRLTVTAWPSAFVPLLERPG